MAETIVLRASDETVMPGLFGSLRLSHKRGAIILDRVKSAAGMPLLADHDPSLPIGRIRRARIEGRTLYQEAEIIKSPRNRPFIAELRRGLRDGLSPGFIIHEAEVEESENGGFSLDTTVTLWEPYETSSTAVPRNPNAAVIAGLDGMDEDDDEDAGADDDEDDSDKHSMPDAAALAAMAASAVKATLSESRALNREILETLSTRQTGEKKPMANSAIVREQKPDEAMAVDVFKAALNGGEIAPESLIGGVLGQKCVVKLAFTSANGAFIGTRSGADRLDPKEQVTAASRILALPNRYEMESLDQQTPEWATDSFPAAATVSEDAVRVDLGGSLVSGSSAPKRIDASANISTIAASMAEGFEEAVLRALYASTDELMAQQLISGDVAQSPLGVNGVRSLAGVGASTYIGTDTGSAKSFWDAEDTLPVRMSSDRRSWILNEALYRVGRRTLLEPGNSLRVVQDGRVAGDAPVIRTSFYPASEGVYGEWTFCNLYIWSEAVLTVDRVSTPGTLKLTLQRYWNFGVSRPDAFVTLKPV